MGPKNATNLKDAQDGSFVAQYIPKFLLNRVEGKGGTVDDAAGTSSAS